MAPTNIEAEVPLVPPPAAQQPSFPWSARAAYTPILPTSPRPRAPGGRSPRSLVALIALGVAATVVLVTFSGSSSLRAHITGSFRGSPESRDGPSGGLDLIVAAVEAHGGSSAPAKQHEEQQKAPKDQPPAQNWWSAALGAIGGAMQQVGQALHVVATSTSTTTTTGTTTTTTTTTSSTTSSTTSTTQTTTITSSTSTITTTTTVLARMMCFAVVRSQGYENGLINAMHDKGVGIFACDEHMVFSNGGVVNVGGVPVPQIDIEGDIRMGNLSEAGTTTSSWLNTLIFLKAWDMIFEDGRWWDYEWIVKVDPDAVFFPNRLKIRLYPYYKAGDTNGPALFVANCDRSWNNEPWSLKLFGSLEVFTRNAVGMYRAYKDKCEEGLDWKGWGEDFYMQECLKLLHVGIINGVDFLGDASCHAAGCGDTHKVAYHPFKDAGSWFSCWGQSNAAPAAPLGSMTWVAK